MFTTKDLVIRTLKDDIRLRKWFEENHDFGLDKVQRVDLKDYTDYVSLILREGLKSGAISHADMTGYQRGSD